ncbi:MAG: S-layer homology domain-containing protein, partial [Peptococcaceae bacterium]|nr:S-layer homology domain-containing protein [Peptococcaceae bacterium]
VAPSKSDFTPVAETKADGTKGTWTFVEWKPSSATIDGADVTFTGTWTFIADIYDLIYNVNGGKFGESADKEATIDDLNAGITYTLWTEQEEAEEQIPTGITFPKHDSVDKDGKQVAVAFIGWTTDNSAIGKIYAAGEEYPDIQSTLKLTEDTTVYAVWGYDEYGTGSGSGDGIPDAQQVVITPADITVYTGGTGYTGILDDNGEELGTTENGLPEPGYYFILPYELNEQFGLSPDQMVNLSNHLRLDYDDGNGDKRSWTLELYNSNEGVEAGDNIANEKYVYRLVPDGDTKSARLEIHDEEGNSVTSDNMFEISMDTLYKNYTMNLYTQGVQNHLVSVMYKTDDQTDWETASDIEGIALGTATLAVRGTSQNNPVTEIQDQVNDTVSSITAEKTDEVTYYTNDSNIPVVNQDEVQLLVDEIVSTAQNDLKDAIVDAAAENDSITIDEDYTFDFNYLDLVDTSNGNAYVTMGDGQKMTLFWPYPEGFDEADTFYIAHFNGLDRNYDNLETALADESTTIDLYSEDTDNEDLKLEKTENGIKITVSSFSPFALVYDADQGSGGNTGGGTTGGGTTPNPPDLNTEDHFSYVVGYEDGMVKPENAITRAEVASIFYRLLKDDVRDANTTDVSEFSDVSASDWYGTTVATLSAMDIVRGYEDGTFRPNAPITRAEFAAIATRFFEETGAEYEPGTFDDVTGNEWFANAIADAVELGLIGGYPDGTVRPNNNITRAEACAIVNRTLGRIPHVDHLLPADEMTTWPDNNPSDWFYADMQEATNGHEYEWTTEQGQKVEEWTEILDKDWEDR